jgi:NADH dehydrogenase FAD-containing subunit
MIVTVNDEEEIECDAVVFAVGISAPSDFYRRVLRWLLPL